MASRANSSAAAKQHKLPDFARRAIVKAGPDPDADQRRVDFPLELSRVDYLRRLVLNCGAAFIAIHRSVLRNNRKPAVAIAVLADIVREDAHHVQEAQHDSGSDGRSKHGGSDTACVEPEPEHVTGTSMHKLSNILAKLCDAPSHDPAYVVAKTDSSATAKKKHRGLKKANDKHRKLLSDWSHALDREVNWVVERTSWLRALCKQVDRVEMRPIGSFPSSQQQFTDSQVKAEFERAIDCLVVLAEACGESCGWNLANVQQLRTQFVRHLQYRRERIKLERRAARVAAGGKALDLDDEHEGPAQPDTNVDGSLQFTYSYDFDSKGIIYYLGTDDPEEGDKADAGHAQDGSDSDGNGDDSLDCEDAWQNPALTQRIRAFRSSEGAGLASDFVGRKAGVYCCTDYREPRQFFGIDLGKYYRVFPQAYTLRHGSSQGILALRDWTLEGSQDGRKWFPVRRHLGDEELPRTAFSTHTWKIEKTMQRKCRLLRVVQTRPVDVAQRLGSGAAKQAGGDAGREGKHHHTGHPTHHALFLSGFEVYGKLVEV